MNPNCMCPTQTYSNIYTPALSPSLESSPGFTLWAAGIDILLVIDMRGEGPPEFPALSVFSGSALSEESSLTIPAAGVGFGVAAVMEDAFL